MVKEGLIDWCLKLLQKSKQPNREYPGVASIHAFCLDFASALLANLLHATSTLELLEADPEMTKNIMNQLLELVTIDTAKNAVVLPTSTLIHLLICLTYLSKERFEASK